MINFLRGLYFLAYMTFILFAFFFAASIGFIWEIGREVG